MALSLKDKARLYHDLGTMLRSGFHLDRGLDLLLGQNPPAGRRDWLEAMRQGLSGGLGVTESLRRQGSGVTDLETGLLAAGEAGGRLDEACLHLAEYFELRQQSLSKAAGAVVYPLIVAHFAVVVPDFSKVVAGGLGAGFSGIPQRLALLWGLIGLAAAVAVAASRAATRSVGVDRLINLLPLLGGARRHWALARFCQVMRTGLLAALRMSETLRLAGGASRSAVMEAGARRAAGEVESGSSLALALRDAGGFPRTFRQSIEVAEQAGTLDSELARWAAAETRLAAQSQDRAAEWVPRVFYFLVVLYVAARVIGMFSSYYGMLGGAMGDLERALHGR